MSNFKITTAVPSNAKFFDVTFMGREVELRRKIDTIERIKGPSVFPISRPKRKGHDYVGTFGHALLDAGREVIDARKDNNA